MSFEEGRILIATEESNKIDEIIKLKVNGKQYEVRVVESESFRTVQSIQNCCRSIEVPQQEDDDDVDNSKDEVADNEIEDQSKGNKKAKESTEDSGKLLNEVATSQHAVENINEEEQKTPECPVKEGPNKQVLNQPTQNVLLALEGANSIHEGESIASHGLASYVEDSEGPIMEACHNLTAPEINGHQPEEGMQLNKYKDFGRCCMNGPIVLDSNNSFRASQLPSLNIQVDLNPKEARKALRKKIRESCMSQETTEFVENTINFITQGQGESQVAKELQATIDAGKILGIKFNSKDLLVMEKTIELENNNRFAPFVRSTPNL